MIHSYVPAQGKGKGDRVIHIDSVQDMLQLEFGIGTGRGASSHL